jgi:hypothetical protein
MIAYPLEFKFKYESIDFDAIYSTTDAVIYQWGLSVRNVPKPVLLVTRLYTYDLLPVK